MGSKANEELGIRPFQVNRTRVSECSEGGGGWLKCLEHLGEHLSCRKVRSGVVVADEVREMNRDQKGGDM